MALKMNITGPRAALLLTVVMTASGGLWLNARPLTMQGVQPAQVAAAIKANSAAFRTFVWQQRMQIQVKGETKKVTLNQMSYDIKGNLQKTQLSEQPPPDSSQPDSGGGRRGRLKEIIVQKKTGEFKDMMEGIASLVKS